MKKFTGLIVFAVVVIALVFSTGMAFARTHIPGVMKTEVQKTDIAVTLNDHIAVLGSVVPEQAIMHKGKEESLKADEGRMGCNSYATNMASELRTFSTVATSGWASSGGAAFAAENKVGRTIAPIFGISMPAKNEKT